MNGAINLFFGLASSAGLGVVLWLLARFIRGAKPGTFWDRDGVACGLSLALVAGLIIVMAWSVKGAMAIVPEPLVGALLGLLASAIAMLVPARIFGRLPAH
jgi:hypothetical protein